MAGDLEQLKRLFEFRIFFGTLPDLNYSCKLYPMVCNLHNICKKLHQFEISILESSYFGLRLSKVYSRFYFYFTIRLLMFILCLHRKSSGIPYKKPPAKKSPPPQYNRLSKQGDNYFERPHSGTLHLVPYNH